LCHDRETYHWQLASDNVAEPSQKRDGRKKAARRNALVTLHVQTLDHLAICEVFVTPVLTLITGWKIPFVGLLVSKDVEPDLRLQP
jgi:hypothetical protein